MDSIVAAGRLLSNAFFGGGAALPRTRREVVQETPKNSSDEESQVIAETASNGSSFSFKTTPSSIEFEGGQNGRVWRRHEYLKSVLNWSTVYSLTMIIYLPIEFFNFLMELSCKYYLKHLSMQRLSKL